MKVENKKLKQLMKDKLHKAGLSDEHADIIAEILTWSDERGYHSHGAVRVEYYAERSFHLRKLVLPAEYIVEITDVDM